MIKQLILLFTITLSVQLIANPVKKSEELCSCLKKAKSSDNAKDKSKCLNLREKHVKALKKGSKNYEKYVENLQSCERELEGNASVDANATVDEKIQKVCDCFQNTDKSNRFSCFKLQSDYGKTISAEEEKIRFTNTSNGCDK